MEVNETTIDGPLRRAVLAVAVANLWPDLVVGQGIALINADAAKEVCKAAREEHASA